MSERSSFDDYLSDWFGLPFKFKSAILSFIQANLTISSQSISGSIATVPTGSLMPFAGATAPNVSWLICNGAAVSRTSYAILFGVIGTTYGVGDGSTTFNIPDLQGRMPVGLGTHTDVSTLGNTDGAVLAARRPRHKTSRTGSASVTTQPSYTVAAHDHAVAGYYLIKESTGGAADTSDAGDFTAGEPVTNNSAAWKSNPTSVAPAVTQSVNAVVTDSILLGPQTGSEPLDAPAYVVVNYLIRT